MARKQHTPEEKARLVLEAIRGERTINEIASENNMPQEASPHLEDGFQVYRRQSGKI